MPLCKLFVTRNPCTPAFLCLTRVSGISPAAESCHEGRALGSLGNATGCASSVPGLGSVPLLGFQLRFTLSKPLLFKRPNHVLNF